MDIVVKVVSTGIEYAAVELLDSIVGLGIVRRLDIVLVGTTDFEECFIDDRHISLLVMLLIEKILVSAA